MVIFQICTLYCIYIYSCTYISALEGPHKKKEFVDTIERKVDVAVQELDNFKKNMSSCKSRTSHFFLQLSNSLTAKSTLRLRVSTNSFFLRQLSCADIRKLKLNDYISNMYTLLHIYIGTFFSDVSPRRSVFHYFLDRDLIVIHSRSQQRSDQRF